MGSAVLVMADTYVYVYLYYRYGILYCFVFNSDETDNSDEEDDKPQYVRLMYKSCYNNLGRYHIDSVSTHSNDSTDSPPSANLSNSLSGS